MHYLISHMQLVNEEKTELNGELAARYFKYYLQLKNPRVVYKVPFNRVSIRSIYSKHKKQFDNLVKLFTKYKLDYVRYIDFFINKLCKFEKDIDTDLISMQTINLYIEHLTIKQKREKIYGYFLKSVDNIVKDCIDLKYNTVIDYLRYLIKHKLLAAKYIAGQISIYYLAAIPKFKIVIDKMDKISRDEFQQLYDRYEKYNVDVNEAFMQMKNIRINVIKYTNDAILNAKNV